MPNYSLVINSRFQPFSFERYIQPLQIYGQAYKEQEDALAELDTKASIWDGLANQQTDPIAHAQYKKFADDLRGQASILATEGLNPSSRQTMLNLRGRYAKEIVPIEQAYKRRAEQMKAQAEIMAKDPTHFFNMRASETSLDRYLADPALDTLSENYSGALLEQQVGQAAEAFKISLTDKSNLSKLGLPFQYERALRYGATPDEVFQAMSKDPNAIPYLSKIVDNVMASSGIRSWSSMNKDWQNNALYKQAEQYALRGLTRAIGTTKYENFTDSYSMQNALAQQEFNRKVNLEREKANAKAEADANAKRLALSSIDLWDTGGYDKRARSIQEKMSTINSAKGNPMAIYEFYNSERERDKYFKNKPYIKKNRLEALKDKTLLEEAKKELDRRNQRIIDSKVNTLKQGTKTMALNEAITLEDYNRNPEKYNRIWIGPQNENTVRLVASSLYDKARASADSMWRQHVLDTYGVSDIIDSKDYSFLQTLQLDNSSNFNEQYRNAIDNTAKQYTAYGTNLSDYSPEKERLTANINNAISNKRYSGRIYRLNADGTQGSGVSSKEISGILTDSKDGINDIYYSNLHKGKLIISTKSGQQLIVDPSLLDSGLNNMLINAKQGIVTDPSTGSLIKIDENDPNLPTLITMYIADKLNAINPRRSKTDKDA